MSDIEFDVLLKKALIKAAGLDYMGNIPADEELHRLVAPSVQLERKMSKLINNPESYVRKLRRPVYQRVLRTAASVLLVISMLFGLSMLNPDGRAKFLEFIRTWFSDRTEYGIVDDATGNIPTSVTLGYVPDGFELVFEVNNSFGAILIYESTTLDYFEISISGHSTGLTIDNEHSKFYSAVVNNYVVDVYETNDIDYPSILICYDESNSLIITVSGTITIDELINILSHITF